MSVQDSVQRRGDFNYLRQLENSRDAEMCHLCSHPSSPWRCSTQQDVDDIARAGPGPPLPAAVDDGIPCPRRFGATFAANGTLVVFSSSLEVVRAGRKCVEENGEEVSKNAPLTMPLRRNVEGGGSLLVQGRASILVVAWTPRKSSGYSQLE